MELGWIFHILIVLGGGIWLLPHCLLFLRAHGRIEQSYNGSHLPSGLGVFVAVLMWLQELLLSLYAAQFPESARLAALQTDYEVYMLASTLIFSVGWMDDTIGHKGVKGVKGHWKYGMAQRTLSMGMVKALGTAVASVWVLLKMEQGTLVLIPIIVKLLLTLLMTNSVNLLDVRPGRALKAFLILAIIVITTIESFEALLLMLPVLVGALLLFPHDLRGEANAWRYGSEFAWLFGWLLVCLMGGLMAPASSCLLMHSYACCSGIRVYHTYDREESFSQLAGSVRTGLVVTASKDHFHFLRFGLKRGAT